MITLNALIDQKQRALKARKDLADTLEAELELREYAECIQSLSNDPTSYYRIFYKANAKKLRKLGLKVSSNWLVDLFDYHGGKSWSVWVPDKK